jgi:mandelate racemase/muconate lactonizing enzyme-like protein
MRIESLKTLHADGGRRAFDFLKATTDDGLVGWSEYNETFGGAGLTALIERLAPALIGKDPRVHEAHVALMQALRRTSAGGVVQQAIGAIENALLDVKARALGIPVYELLGGPVRDRIRLYWSHCGTYRVGWWQELGLPPPRDPGRRDSPRPGGREPRLHGAQDQRDATGGPPSPAQPGVRARRGLPRAQPRPARARRGPRPARGVPRGRRARCRHPGRPELQLQDRGIPEGRPGHRAVRHPVDRDRHALAERAPVHPRAQRDRGGLGRVPLRPPRLPPVPRARRDGRGDHRRPLERGRGVGEDRLDGRRLRGQRGAPTTSTATSRP